MASGHADSHALDVLGTGLILNHPYGHEQKCFEMAWKIRMMTAAVMERGVFRPTQTMISPRLPMVEYASTRLELLWAMAKQ